MAKGKNARGKEPANDNFEVARIDRPLSLVAQVERILRQAIAENRFPGDRLPTEVELADQLGVSRETVRRAAETLQREGLLVKIRRKGTFTHFPKLSFQIKVTESTLLGYLQANYPAAHGQAEAVTPAISGLMLQGAIEEAAKHRFELIVRQAPHMQMGDAFHHLHQNARLRGVIFASYGEEKLLRRVAGLGVPIVLVDHDLPLPQINSVRDDSFEGARQAIDHLAKLGHRRIAFAHWRHADLNPWRLRGYRQGLRDVGLSLRRKWEIPCELTEAGAHQVIDEFLALSPRPTALYCFNNSLARLVIDELSRRGLRVPEDVSILGGGGEEIPGLTCHQCDWQAMGRYAVQILVRTLSEPGKHAPEHHLSQHVLRPGRTTAPPPAKISSE